jgi:hypothetical protein
MIDWERIYQKMMNEINGNRLIPHLLLLGSFVFLGLILGMYIGHNVYLILLVWLIGGILDYLIYGTELLELLNKDEPYMLSGIVEQRIRKVIQDEDAEYEEFYFIVEVEQAHTIDKNGLSPVNYPDKEGEQRLEVPESMFLSFRQGDAISVVCTPDDLVWAWIRDHEVIEIDE